MTITFITGYPGSGKTTLLQKLITNKFVNKRWRGQISKVWVPYSTNGKTAIIGLWTGNRLDGTDRMYSSCSNAIQEFIKQKKYTHYIIEGNTSRVLNPNFIEFVRKRHGRLWWVDTDHRKAYTRMVKRDGHTHPGYKKNIERILRFKSLFTPYSTRRMWALLNSHL